MSKYRIQATIEASRLPGLVGLLYEDVEKFDPELKIYRIVEYATAQAEPSTANPVQPEPAAPANVQNEPASVRDNPYVSMDSVIERALKSGPKRWMEMRGALVAGGFAPGSIGSAIKARQKAGTIQNNDGLWSLVENAPS